MAERSKAAVLKTVSGETRSGVRIPVPPPERPVRAVLAERRGFRRSSAPCRSRFGLESPSLCDSRSWRLAGELFGLPQALIGSFQEPLRASNPCPSALCDLGGFGERFAGRHCLVGQTGVLSSSPVIHRLQDPEHLIPGILRKRESGLEPRPDTSRNRNGNFANLARGLYSRCWSSDLRWWRRGADRLPFDWRSIITHFYLASRCRRLAPRTPRCSETER